MRSRVPHICSSINIFGSSSRVYVSVVEIGDSWTFLSMENVTTFVWPKQQFCSPHVRLMHSGDTLAGASYRHNRAAEPLCTQV